MDHAPGKPGSLKLLGNSEGHRHSVHSNSCICIYYVCTMFLFPHIAIVTCINNNINSSTCKFPWDFRMFRPLFSMYACDCNCLWCVSYILDVSKMGSMSIETRRRISTFIGRCGGRLKDIYACKSIQCTRRYVCIQNKPASISPKFKTLTDLPRAI